MYLTWPPRGNVRGARARDSARAGRADSRLLRVRLLEPLRDLLQPAQLDQACAADDHSPREREPRFERPAQEAEPGRARRVHLRPGSLEIRDLGMQLTRPGLELDRASDVGEAEERATGLHVL